jgi:hypothetical protein
VLLFDLSRFSVTGLFDISNRSSILGLILTREIFTCLTDQYITVRKISNVKLLFIIAYMRQIMTYVALSTIKSSHRPMYFMTNCSINCQCKYMLLDLLFFESYRDRVLIIYEYFTVKLLVQRFRKVLFQTTVYKFLIEHWSMYF